MSSTLGSFLSTLFTEREHGFASADEATMPVFVNDNAKMMRRTCCASYCSSNGSDSDVAATPEDAKKTEIKPTNWDRLCSPISARRSVLQKTLSLPLRKLSNDNIASTTKNQPPAQRRCQSMSLVVHRRNDSFERIRCSSRNAYNTLFASSLKRKPATKTASMPLRTKVSEDDMTSLRQNESSAATSTKNATFVIPLKRKTNPFTALFPTRSKEKDLNRALECPQRKPSVDTMFSIMKTNRASIRTPSNHGNASFDTESLKSYGTRAPLNPFKCLVESPTEEESLHKKIVTFEEVPMPIIPLASSKTNKLALKSAFKTSSSKHNAMTKSFNVESLTDHLQISYPESFNDFQVTMGFNNNNTVVTNTML
jgi:hypothetical protein